MGDTFKRKQRSLSKKELDQKIISANKNLKARNKSLECIIKDEEKALKSLKKECSAESKKLKRLLIDIEFQEGRFQKLVNMIRRFEQRLFDAKDQAADEEDKLNAILSKEDEYIKWEWLKKVKRLWSKFKQ